MNTLLKTCATLLALTPLLHAEDRVFKNSNATGNLIELFSSEGCSSCPPAEDWVNRLQTSVGLWKDVFPVVFHVDYWDGLGWPDRFARKEFTLRQNDYATSLHQDSLYTPEFVINGREWRSSWLSNFMLPTDNAAKSGDLTLTVHDDGTYSAIYRKGKPTDRPALLNIALVGFHVVTDVKRGENNGKKLEHDFVALGFSTTRVTLHPDQTFQANAEAIKLSTDDPAGAVVAWISDANGAILQITGGWLSPSGLSAAR